MNESINQSKFTYQLTAWRKQYGRGHRKNQSINLSLPINKQRGAGNMAAVTRGVEGGGAPFDLGIDVWLPFDQLRAQLGVAPAATPVQRCGVVLVSLVYRYPTIQTADHCLKVTGLGSGNDVLVAHCYSLDMVLSSCHFNPVCRKRETTVNNLVSLIQVVQLPVTCILNCVLIYGGYTSCDFLILLSIYILWKAVYPRHTVHTVSVIHIFFSQRKNAKKISKCIRP